MEIASALRTHEAEILESNQRDLAHAEGNAAFLDRLTLTSSACMTWQKPLNASPRFPDTVGKVMKEWTLPNGRYPEGFHPDRCNRDDF